MPAELVSLFEMNNQKSRTSTAAFVLLQGLVTAVLPQLSVKFITKMIGRNFDNASELEAKPAYRQQLRAIGVGMVAAAGTDLLLQSVGDTDEGPFEADQPELDNGEGAEPDESAE